MYGDAGDATVSRCKLGELECQCGRVECGFMFSMKLWGREGLRVENNAYFKQSNIDTPGVIFALMS